MKTFISLIAKNIIRHCLKSCRAVWISGVSVDLQTMHAVVTSLMIHTQLSKKSCILDIGSGLGRQTFHFNTHPGVAISFGIEPRPLSCDLCCAS